MRLITFVLKSVFNKIDRLNYYNTFFHYLLLFLFFHVVTVTFLIFARFSHFLSYNYRIYIQIVKKYAEAYSGTLQKLLHTYFNIKYINDNEITAKVDSRKVSSLLFIFLLLL